MSDPAASDPAAPQEDAERGESEGDEAERADSRREVILAIDIGGTKFASGLVTYRGELLDRSRVEVEADVVSAALARSNGTARRCRRSTSHRGAGFRCASTSRR
jgi:hypothetical protein